MGSESLVLHLSPSEQDELLAALREARDEAARKARQPPSAAHTREISAAARRAHALDVALRQM